MDFRLRKTLRDYQLNPSASNAHSVAQALLRTSSPEIVPDFSESQELARESVQYTFDPVSPQEREYVETVFGRFFQLIGQFPLHIPEFLEADFDSDSTGGDDNYDVMSNAIRLRVPPEENLPAAFLVAETTAKLITAKYIAEWASTNSLNPSTQLAVTWIASQLP